MAIDCTLNTPSMLLRVTGEIDHHRAGQLMRELEAKLDLDSPKEVELDLSGVTFMDSSGIALLMRLYRSLSLTGAKLRVVQVPPQAGKVLKAAGLGKLFSISFL